MCIFIDIYINTKILQLVMEGRLKKFGEFEGARNEAIQATDNSWKTLENGNEILDVAWRAAGKSGTVGIVAVHNKEMDYWYACLGIASSANEESTDARDIANTGNKLVKEEAIAFFPYIKDIKYKK